MNKVIFSIIVVFALILIIPSVNAQLSLGAEANQKLIEVKVDNSKIVQVKHIVVRDNLPVNLELFQGKISNLVITNEKGEEKEVGKFNDGYGKESLTILPSKENTIINYDLENVKTFYDNVWTLRIHYDEQFSILFSEETELIFLNNNVIHLGDKKGLSVNGGGNVNLQYYSEISKVIKNVQWEEEQFNVEIITDAKIKNFDFSQESKSIDFQIDSKNKFVTINMSEELLGGPYVVLLNNEKIQYSKYNSKENFVSLSMKPESSGQITIIGTTVIPEFSMFIPLIMGFVIVLTVPFMKKFNLH